jgi:S1/P1 Nuclease
LTVFSKAEALKFVVHFVGDFHQPLHDEDNGDKGGNERHVIFDGKSDNLHWVWDTGLLEHINRNPRALATELEQHHHSARSGRVGQGQHRGLGARGPPPGPVDRVRRLAGRRSRRDSSAYQRQADAAIELQLEKAGVRLAYLLNAILK